MVVEEQQVGAVVYRCGAVPRHDPPAQLGSCAVEVWLQDDDRMARFAGIGHRGQRGGQRHVVRHHTQIGIRTVHAEIVTTAMDRQVLQLHGPPFGHAGSKQCLVERAVARQQLVPHEYFADKAIDEGRVDAMTAEIAGSR